MLRFRILVSVAPLIMAAILARIEFFPSSHPCIAVGSNTVEIASSPWHADLHVSFTDDPTLATVRVAISDNPETADFAMTDDVDVADEGACVASPATRFIAITGGVAAASPVIYLMPENGAADYRIFVRSKRFSAREATALIVGAHRGGPPLAAATLEIEPLTRP